MQRTKFSMLFHRRNFCNFFFGSFHTHARKTKKWRDFHFDFSAAFNMSCWLGRFFPTFHRSLARTHFAVVLRCVVVDAVRSPQLVAF